MKNHILALNLIIFVLLIGCSSAPNFDKYLTNNQHFYHTDTNNICSIGINYLENYLTTNDFKKLKIEWKLAIYKSLMDCYERSNDYNNAIKFGLKIIESPSKSNYVTLYYDDYSENYSFGSFEKPTFDKIAYLYFLNNDYKNSINYYLKQIDMNNSTDAVIGLSELYKSTGKETEGIKLITKSIYLVEDKIKEAEYAELYTKDLANLYFKRGVLYLKIKNKDKACNDFRKSMDLGNYEANKYILESCF